MRCGARTVPVILSGNWTNFCLWVRAAFFLCGSCYC